MPRGGTRLNFRYLWPRPSLGHAMAQGNETVAQKGGSGMQIPTGNRVEWCASNAHGRCGGVGRVVVSGLPLWEDTNGTGQVQCEWESKKRSHLLCRLNESGIGGFCISLNCPYKWARKKQKALKEEPRAGGAWLIGSTTTTPEDRGLSMRSSQGRGKSRKASRGGVRMSG